MGRRDIPIKYEEESFLNTRRQQHHHPFGTERHLKSEFHEE